MIVIMAIMIIMKIKAILPGRNAKIIMMIPPINQSGPPS